jgi:hypothetical protein
LIAVIAGFCAGHVLSHAAVQSPQERPLTRVGKSKEVEEATVVDPKHISESSRIRGRLYSLGYKDDDLVARKAWGEKEPLMTIRERPWRTFEWEENLDDLNKYIYKTVCRAEAIVVGGVVSKTSQLTEYRDYVFTDYEVKIEEVLKNATAAKLEVNSPIVVSSGGGSVKVGDKVIRFADKSWAQYKKGVRYLFFLKYAPTAAVYQGIIGDNSFALYADRVDVPDDPHYQDFNRQLINRSGSSLIEQVHQAATNCR